MEFGKDMLLLYAVTDRSEDTTETLYEQVKAALDGGVTMVQLREKNIDEESLVKEALEIKKLCHSYNVPLIINDNVEAAIKSGADGVHVGIEDMPVAEIRKRVGRDFIIGATAKTVEQAKAAERAGADYLGVGAVFPSPTKINAIRITNEQLKEIALSVKIPIVAIGGINLENVLELRNSGVNGIAVVSAIFSADDIEVATVKLRETARTVVDCNLVKSE